MTLPPCYEPPDDDEPLGDLSRRDFLAATGTSLFVAPILAKTAADPSPAASSNSVAVNLKVNGRARQLRLDPRTTVYHATGKRVRDLPITVDKLL